MNINKKKLIIVCIFLISILCIYIYNNLGYYIGLSYGKDSAMIEIVNYTSFQCGGCVNMHEVLGETIQKYIDSGDIKYIEKQIDIKRFEYDDLIYKHMNEEQMSDFDKLSKIYENQNEWIKLKTPEEVIEFLDLEEKENKKHIKDIEKINKEKIQLELKEVPAMFINGERVPSDISKEEFEDKIEKLKNTMK